MPAPSAPRLLPGFGIAAGALASALGIGIVLVCRAQPQRVPAAGDYALGCGIVAAVAVGIFLVMSGGVCSLLGLVEASRRKLSPVPAAIGLALNLAQPVVAFAGDALGAWVR
jgi:hypothetical protein